jgi:hypothetical protein
MEYVVNVTTEGPVSINLGQSFDSNWHAYSGNTTLEHIESFSFTNEFYLNSTGSHQILIRYEVTPVASLLKTASIFAMFFSILVVLADILLLNTLRVRKKSGLS